MPLSQILIDGEGWKKAEGKPEKPKGIGNLSVKSPDGSTQFSVRDVTRTIRAHRLEKDGTFGRGVPYCHLRMNSSGSGVIVTGLVVDTDGRIHAATEVGVQVFDPTGRLCGVLTMPSRENTPTLLAFEGDRLTMWIGDTKYARKLNATGAK
jgi:enterochelin esterase family protein